MRFRLTVACVAALSALAALSQPATAQSGKKSPGGLVSLDPCPTTAQGLPETFNCTCSLGGNLGTVWGSGPYTADSNLCTAATHAGAIRAAGGRISVARRPGQNSYSGSTAHGISTNGWGPYDVSFVVAAYGQVPTAAPVGLPTCGLLPKSADIHVCACPANVPFGSVWGNSPYTTDSDICSAAVHSGYIKAPDGGRVVVLRMRGLERYAGTESHGVTTSDWGSYTSSFIFDWNQ